MVLIPSEKLDYIVVAHYTNLLPNILFKKQYFQEDAKVITTHFKQVFQVF